MVKKPITVTANDDLLNRIETEIKIVRPITERTSMVWTMSKRDALELFHRLGDYIVANTPKDNL